MAGRRAMAPGEVLRLLAFDMPMVEDDDLAALERALDEQAKALPLSRRSVAGLDYAARRGIGDEAPSQAAAEQGSASMRALWALKGKWMLSLLGLPLADAADALAYYVEAVEEPEVDHNDNVEEATDLDAAMEELTLAAEEDDDDFVFESMDDSPPPVPSDEPALPLALQAAKDDRSASWQLLSAKLDDLLSVLHHRAATDAYSLVLLNGAQAADVDLAARVALAACEHAHLSESTRGEITLKYTSILLGCLSQPDTGAAALASALRIAGAARASLPSDHVDAIHTAILVRLRRIDSPSVSRRLLAAQHADIFALICELPESHFHASTGGPAVFGLTCMACTSATSAAAADRGVAAAKRLLSVVFDNAAPARSRLDALQALLTGAVALPRLLEYCARIPGLLDLALLLTRADDAPQHAMWALLAATMPGADAAGIDRKAHFNTAALLVRDVMRTAAATVTGPPESIWSSVEDARQLVGATRMLGWMNAWKRAGGPGYDFFQKQTVIKTYFEEYRAVLQALPAPPERAVGENEDEEGDGKEKREKDGEASWRRSVARWATAQLNILKGLLATASGDKAD